MSQARLSTAQQDSVPVYAGASSNTPLASLVYRSRALTDLPQDALRNLVQAAQSRNHAEAITGLMVYDGPHFYQWLEGPADGVARVMRSILQDTRHTDIQILSQGPIQARMFKGWDMKLATRGPAGNVWRHDVMYPRLETLRALRRDPEAVPQVMAALARHTVARPLHNADPGSAILETLIHTRVIPELVARRVAPVREAFPQPVTELAQLLLEADATPALDLIHEQLGEARSVIPLYTSLLEPAARRLGDLWGEDKISEFDVTVGLSHLQTAVRLLGADTLPVIPATGTAPAVLVVPVPGEVHGLGAALDSEAMWTEGWSPQSEFPRDDEGLKKILKAEWYDVLDLSLSTAFRREHWLPRLMDTIRVARQASRNPNLVIAVGGRVFAERAATAAQVEADHAVETAAGIVSDLRHSLPDRKE